MGLGKEDKIESVVTIADVSQKQFIIEGQPPVWCISLPLALRSKKQYIIKDQLTLHLL